MLRFALYADLILLAGLAAWAAFGPKWARALFRVTPWRSSIAGLAIAGVAIAAAATLVSIGAMMGQPVGEVELDTVRAILFETGLGWAFMVRAVALTAVVLACLLPASETARLRAIAACSAVALGSFGWSGHAAASEGLAGTLHRLNDAAHLFAAALWIAAIAMFVTDAWKPARSNTPEGLAALATALRSFAPVGTLLVLVVAATGITNLLLIVGWQALPEIWPGRYGTLLLTKLALFAGILTAAGLHRWFLAPSLNVAIERAGEPDRTLQTLRISLAVEFLLSILILAVVAWLGMTAP